jgi:hypothetical protein
MVMVGIVAVLGCAPRAIPEDLAPPPPTREILTTEAAPAAIGPYSQAVQVARLPKDARIEIMMTAVKISE